MKLLRVGMIIFSYLMFTFAAFSQGPKEGCFAKFANVLTQVKEWEFDSGVERQLAAVWSNPHLSEQEKFLQYYETFVNARLQDTHFVGRFFAKSAARKSLRQSGLYSFLANPIAKGLLFGPHYNPLFNRISMPDFKQRTLADLIVAFHEFDHALERSKNPLPFILLLSVVPKELWMAIPTPVMPLSYLRIESTALGSQWEFMQRIPQSTRVRWMEMLSATIDTNVLEQRLEVMKNQGTLQRLYNKLMPDLTKQYGFKRAEIILREHIVTGLMDSRNDHLLPVEVPSFTPLASDDFPNFYNQTKKAVQQLSAPSILGKEIQNIALQTIVHSFYSKQQFIHLQGEIQNYTAKKLLKRHYAGAWRKVIWINLAIVSIYAASSQVPEKEWNSMWARDIKFYLNYLSHRFNN